MSEYSGKMTKVLLVEDETFVRALIKDMLESADYKVEATGTADEAHLIAASFKPDVLVTDIHLGSATSGIDLAHALMAKQNIKGLVFLTNVPDPKIIGADAKAIPKGSAYLNKNRLGDPGTLVEAIKATLAKRVPDQYRDDKSSESETSDLSRTQIEVLHLVAQGLSNQEIAERRKTGVRAVENLLQRSYESLGIEAEASSNARVRAVISYLKAAGLNRG